MRWKVEVHGQSFDLADLVVAVGGLGASTFRDGEKTFLYTEAFEQMDTAAEVNHAAEALIGTINASLRLLTPPRSHSRSGRLLMRRDHVPISHASWTAYAHGAGPGPSLRPSRET